MYSVNVPSTIRPVHPMANMAMPAWALLALLLCFPASSQAATDATKPTTKTISENKRLDLSNSKKLFHQGITIVALPPPPGNTTESPTVDGNQAIENIRKGYDYLLAHSPYAARTVQKLQSSGPIVIFFSPTFPAKNTAAGNATMFAVFNPSILVRPSGGKSYSVIIGHHLIQWPEDELAWALGHELVGHGIQHYQNRLDRSRLNDLECEAFLHQERVLQELQLWKNSDLMVRVRQQMEDKWCVSFRNYMTQKDPKKMKLWDVRDMDVPQLLKIYERYASGW